MYTLVCPRCNGKGKSVAFRERENIYMSWYTWQDCPSCQGTGQNLNRLAASVHPLAPITETVVTLAACIGIASPPTSRTKRSALVANVKL
jgi:hypothetical protein